MLQHRWRRRLCCLTVKTARGGRRNDDAVSPLGWKLGLLPELFCFVRAPAVVRHTCHSSVCIHGIQARLCVTVDDDGVGVAGKGQGSNVTKNIGGKNAGTKTTSAIYATRYLWYLLRLRDYMQRAFQCYGRFAARTGSEPTSDLLTVILP